LYKRGFIHKIERGRKIFFNFGKSSGIIFWPEFRRFKENKFKKGWDKSWWILLYDVPEKLKLKRNCLREFIKSLGFSKLQNSCWISPYDYSTQINNFCR